MQGTRAAMEKMRDFMVGKATNLEDCQPAPEENLCAESRSAAQRDIAATVKRYRLHKRDVVVGSIGMLRTKMNNLVHLLRRLVDVISTLSLPPRPLSICIDLAYTRSISGCETRPASPQRTPQPPQGNATIHRLMINPTLFDPTRAPRYPIVLCHGMHPCIDISVPLLDLVPGLYGFDARGPAAFPGLRLHYWSSVLSILKHKLGADVIVTGVPGYDPHNSFRHRIDASNILKNRFYRVEGRESRSYPST